jgi:hypothetical protein
VQIQQSLQRINAADQKSYVKQEKTNSVKARKGFFKLKQFL